MKEKIEIIIADDNIALCRLMKEYLEQHEFIEILGCVHTDEEEVEMIDKLKPQIVITDLMRNHIYSGLDIIKKYKCKSKHPKFLIISAAPRENINIEKNMIDGYIKKPFLDYNIITQEINRIADEL